MEFKFDSKDRIMVKSNYFTGTIIATVLFNTPKRDLLYHICWDHIPNQMFPYMASDVDDLWEKIAQIKDATILGVDPGSSYINQDPDRKLPVSSQDWRLPIFEDDKKKECDHKWVNASLQFEKLCCYHCGIDKP